MSQIDMSSTYVVHMSQITMSSTYVKLLWVESNYYE